MKNNSSFFYIFIILFSFISSESNNSYIDYYHENIILTIDPFNINTFSLNRYFPNQNEDMTYYSIKFDGSTFIPLVQSMPSKFYFDINDNGILSQFIYNQRKADTYFDSSIALKKDLDEITDMLLQLETKSIVDNINQNFFLNYNKNNEKLNIDFSYMYHYEEDPENYEVINNDQLFLKALESYNSGFSIDYFLNNLNFSSTFSSQISSHKRPELFSNNYAYIDYESQIFWNENKIEYLFTDSFNFYLKNKYKKNIIENNQDHLHSYKHNIVSTGLSYSLSNRFKCDFGGDYINKKVLPSFNFKYLSNVLKVSLSLENKLMTYFVDTNQLFGNYNHYEIQNYNLNATLSFKSIYNSIDIGLIDNDEFDYKYFLLDGSINVSKIKLDYRYYNYIDAENINLGIDRYSKVGISYYPFKDKYKFELYGKINVHQYHIDSNINLLTLNPFSNQNIEYKNVSLYNTEIGFIFDSFTILYISNNILNEEIIYSNYINPFQRLDYINIIWVFKE